MRESEELSEVGSRGSPGSHEVPDQTPAQELRALQLAELGILNEFVRLCEAHGLRYYLAYGTLLGAVRHRGFIPWDDDIDVTMPRDDYKRLAQIYASVPPSQFMWQSYMTEPEYPHLFGRVIKTGTVLRHAASDHLPFQQSIHIDVFPLDGIANRPWDALMQRLLVRICRIRLGVGLTRRPVKRLLVQAARVLPRRSAVFVIERLSRRYPTAESSRWICIGGPYGHSRQSFSSEWFGPGAAQMFEGRVFVGPAAWDEYLTHLYGDYMSPPPPNDRVSQHRVTDVQLESVTSNSGPAPTRVERARRERSG
jgi:lipopolysaccharide cholinephosphotransferase